MVIELDAKFYKGKGGNTGSMLFTVLGSKNMSNRNWNDVSQVGRLQSDNFPEICRLGIADIHTSRLRNRVYWILFEATTVTGGTSWSIQDGVATSFLSASFRPSLPPPLPRQLPTTTLTVSSYNSSKWENWLQHIRRISKFELRGRRFKSKTFNIYKEKITL